MNPQNQDLDGMRMSTIMDEEMHHKVFFEEANDAMFVADLVTGKLVVVNRQATVLTGRSKQELIGMHFLQLHPADKSDHYAKLFQESIAGKIEQPVEAEIVTIENKRVPVEINASNITLSGRRLALGIFRNITSRKQAEIELKNSQNLLQSIMNTIPVRVFWKDLSLKYLGCNLAFAKDAGFDSPEQVVGKEDYQMAWQPQAELYRKDDREVMETESARINYEEAQQTPDGRTIWLRTSKIPLHNSLGELIGVLGTYEDITSRKNAENEAYQHHMMLMQVLNSIPQSVFWKNRESVYLGCNAVFARTVGFSHQDDIIGKSDFDLPWPRSEAETYRLDDREVMEQRRSKPHIIEPLQQADGRRLWIDTTKVPLLDKNGDVFGVLGVYEDITENKKKAEELVASEARYRSLFESMQEGFALHEVIFDTSGRPCDYRYLVVNSAFERITGIPRDQWIGRTVREVLPQIESSWIERFGAVAVTGESIQYEDYVRDLDRYYRVIAYSPQRGQFAVVSLDITERIRAEQALRVSESRYRQVSRLASDFIFSCAEPPQGSYRVNWLAGAVEGISGYSIEEIMSRGCWKFMVHSDDVPLFDEHVTGLTPGASGRCELRIIRRDGDIRWLRVVTHLLEMADATESSLYGSATDITERRTAILALQKSEAMLRSVFSAAPVCIAIVTKDRIIQSVNQQTCDLYGYAESELVGASARLLYGDEVEFERVGQAMSRMLPERSRATVEAQTRHKNGTVIPVLISSSLLRPDDANAGVVTTVMDLTRHKQVEGDRLKMERQMLQVQKLESLGVLAGGIAHDFNNLLMAILGNADLALDELPPMSPARESIREIEKASRRAADLCRQMLAYSGKGKFVVETIDLRELVEEMVHLLKTSISKKVLLNLHLEKKLPSMIGDATQIRQIVMNLVINASEAIGDRSGIITISTGASECLEEYLKGAYLDEAQKPGLYVWLEISDNGCGMDAETQRRIFEPFFTTKFTGRGLGLSAVMGIVRGHKGALKVYSEPGKGTSFKMLFPAQEDDKVLKVKNGAAAADWSYSGTVLLVDDEETVRAVGKKMLERIGFKVLTAEDGREGVKAYQAHQSEICLVLLDLTMPHLNGEETFRALRMLNPQVRVVMCSGYTEVDVATRFSGKGLAGFVQKPYNMGELRERLRVILEKGL